MTTTDPNTSQSNNTTVATIPDENSLAWQIFTAFVSSDQIRLTEDELRHYAIKDLQLNAEKMPVGLNEHLPVILIAFMNMWSGWHFKSEFLAGKFQKEAYFQRFQKFMVHKMNTVVHGQFASVIRSLGEVKKDTEFSPNAIHISCPADMLNTIVFSNIGDDVIMKQHLGAKWLDLTPSQLLHWPHVEVTFSTQDIHLVRGQATEFVRYLNFLPHESGKDCDSIIEHAESYGNQVCYSFNYLDAYIDVYIKSLKSCSQINAGKLFEIQCILSHFLEDVKYLDVNKSMPTDTVVRFRLSPVPFIRNKKLVKNNDKEGEEARVGYCEIIIPKIQLLLVYFKPVQKDGPTISFDYTDKLKNAGQHSDISAMPKITYRCTFCKVEYRGDNSKNLMLQHLKGQHKMEQHVRCTLCKKQFEVMSLAACRWKHKCQPFKTGAAQKSLLRKTL